MNYETGDSLSIILDGPGHLSTDDINRIVKAVNDAVSVFGLKVRQGANEQESPEQAAET